jgi:hypothetical protein
VEALHDRGWTDGLPVVPPTEERVLRMLTGTSRDPDEVVAVVRPTSSSARSRRSPSTRSWPAACPSTCRSCWPRSRRRARRSFALHGLLATTYFSGPVVVVNGPVARAVGMNSGSNALGQGNRANATIGRRLQLVVRNVGGGRPGEVDQATLGNPGKLTFCFAEREHDSPFAPLAQDRGRAGGTQRRDAVRRQRRAAVVDQLSRDPHSLARTFAAALRVNAHPKLPMAFDAMLVVSPEHGRVSRTPAGTAPGCSPSSTAAPAARRRARRGAGGMAEGVPDALAGVDLPKFRPGGCSSCTPAGTQGSSAPSSAVGVG